jgi:hypothetical protein
MSDSLPQVWWRRIAFRDSSFAPASEQTNQKSRSHGVHEWTDSRGIARHNHVRNPFVGTTLAEAHKSNNRGRTAGEMMSNRWIIKKRHETLKLIIYSVIGLIIVTVLVTLLNYAMYNNSPSKLAGLPVAILARL